MRTQGDYQYDPSNCVGQGAFGKVYKAKQISTGKTVAIKKIDAQLIGQQQYLQEAIKNEIQILKTLDHPNIVKFIEKFETTRSIYIVTEFCENGDLQRLMQNNLYEQEVQYLFSQIIDGMRVLVDKNIIHRDLKPANILNDKGIMKIADFGFAKFINDYNSQLIKTCVGSPLYMSPQILNGQKYNTKSDIWSLGVIYYEMLYKKTPFYGQNQQELRNNIMENNLIFPNIPKISQKSKDFLIGALKQKENDRLSWDEVFTLFKDIKINPNIKRLSELRQEKESEIIQISVVSFKYQIQRNKEIRQQLSFTYFVIVEMIQNYNLFEDFCPEQDFENLCLFFAKMVNLKYSEYIEKTYKLLNIGDQLYIYKNFLEIINEESMLARNLLEDILTQFSQQQNMENQISKYTVEQLDNIVKIRILGLVKSILEKQRNSFEVLRLLNYMIETLITKNQLQNNQDIDYREIHEIKQFKDNLEQFAQVIQQKVKKFDNE